MSLEAYRRVLALPGVRPLLLLALVARVPVTAVAVTLTLHVVLDLGRGYAAAGLVGTAFTVGAALAAPLLGRLVDRRGLRLMLGATTLAEAVFWSTAPGLPFLALLVAALVGGLVALPVFSVIRQSLAALVPPAQRRPAYALDSMSLELSYMTGPALAVLLVSAASAQATMYAVGAGIVLSGVALFALNPPVRGAPDPPAHGAPDLPARGAPDPPVRGAPDPADAESDRDGLEERPVSRREWLRGPLIAVLAVTAAATIVLGGTDVAVVASLRAAGQVQWTGAVLAIWAVYSMIGGFIYGTVRRSLSPIVLIGLMGAFTIPVGLVSGWGWLCLALLPPGIMCAPSLATTADQVSRLAPAGSRGEAMGLHGSAITIGLALGAPLVGAVIDASTPSSGFLVAGLAGGLIALIVGLLVLRGIHNGRSRTQPGGEPSLVSSLADS